MDIGVFLSKHVRDGIKGFEGGIRKAGTNPLRSGVFGAETVGITIDFDINGAPLEPGGIAKNLHTLMLSFFLPSRWSSSGRRISVNR